MFRISGSYDNIAKVTISLLQKLNVKVTDSIVNETLQHHPDYPSLLSISDSLKQWKVESAALQIDTPNLEKIPTPFIAHIKNANGNFVLVTSVNGSVQVINTKGKEQTISRKKFEEAWSNTVLLAEASAQSGDKDYKKNLKKERTDHLRIPFIVFTSLLLALLYAFQVSLTATGVWSLLMLFTKLGGCIVTGLLLWLEIDKSNPVLKQICSIGKKTDCTAVLSSSHARLFGRISWSEIGFYYFTGGFIFLLMTGTEGAAAGIISRLALMAVPYTIFSIYYQWRVVKQWCSLCLGVQGLLFAEGVLGYFMYQNNPGANLLNGSPALSFATAFAIPVLFWLFAKPVLKTAQLGKEYKKETGRLKQNPEIFKALLHRQRQIILSTEGLGITIGNPEATQTIVKVCNPYCSPCARAHGIIHEMLANNNNLKVQIIFTVTDNENDVRTKPVRHLLALYEKGDEQLIEAALDNWYGARNKDYNAFQKLYPMKDELQHQHTKLKAMEQWCQQMQIAATPTFFINGYQLPAAYQVEDLHVLLS